MKKRSNGNLSLRKTHLYFTELARIDGTYKGKPRPFCLHNERAEENLFSEIRTSALTYFAQQGIKWHDGQSGKPSNHLCDSQVCCINFLFPFADKPAALIEFLRPVFPAICHMLPMEKIANQFVSFEWIGLRNYLGEKVPQNGRRTRGRNFTSADAAVMFKRKDGLRQIALIEWKYTESYTSMPLKVAPSGTDRAAIYAPLFKRKDCPLNKKLLPTFDALFFEPFYQLMRQQFLADEMERARELDADIVSILHIAPAHNLDFRIVTSPTLQPLGNSAIDIWKRLVRTSDRFTSINTEELFGRFPIKQPELSAWSEYVNCRYSWLREYMQ